VLAAEKLMTTTIPSIFIGHGSPMNTLESNGYTRAWQKLGRALPRPRGILVVSAHWFIGATAVTAMQRPRTIHDFYGFPDELFAFDYPAPGLPELAAEVVELAKPDWVGLDRDQWGLDHGTWSVLAHLYPAADVPVVQLSLNALKPMEYHIQLATRLAALRERGVMILASGNIVHNLRRIDWRSETGEDWAHRFDDAAASIMKERPAEVSALREHADFPAAVPTPDHFLPLLYLAGIAAASGAPALPLVRGCTLGSVSMSCYGVGMEGVECVDGAGAAGVPRDVPPDQTNL
jgi:4,5-DOPA dioxygenase extradiol